ncbi:WD40-repeat-containing domain protein, partial [Blyttiomyces helicus]
MDIALNQHHVGAHNKCIRPTEDIFNSKEERIKEDILRLIVQYLNDEGYHVSKMTILDEANVKSHEREERHIETKRVRKAVLDGDWAEVDRLCSKPLVKNHKSFLYAVYKQQYLEYIEHHEIQKAFTHLNKRLKPLEHLQKTPSEFKDLCYLLTAKSVHDAVSFKSWEGIGPSREKLAEQFQNMVDMDSAERQGSVYVPPQRLLTLLRQAVAYQIEFSRYHPRIAPKVTTLLEDYASLIIPNAVCHTFTGHKGNVKCVEFVGEEGSMLVSGSGDNTCRVWDTDTAECLGVLEGHTSRIWDVASSKDGLTVASASGDGTVKLWDMKSSKMECSATLQGNSSGDVYTVNYHPSGRHIVTGGYDKVVRLFDVERGVVVKTFTGHQLSVSKTIFNPLGNLIITGSKDNTIKFWDILSGLCIKTITSHLGEVTSVEMNSNGSMLLSSSKDNSNRLWDIRTVWP